MYQDRKVNGHVLCDIGIDFASSYDFDILFWKSSDSVFFFFFFFICAPGLHLTENKNNIDLYKSFFLFFFGLLYRVIVKDEMLTW